MVGQLSAVYYQSYKLAYEMARLSRACLPARASRHQPILHQVRLVDGSRQGLLAGERLGADLRRMGRRLLQPEQAASTS